MTNEELINAMLEEIDARLMEYLDGDTTGPSKHSIIEKYFKQIREDTKGECVGVVEKYHKPSGWSGNPDPSLIAEEIKKL